MTEQTAYVLGTHQAELDRLGLQHAVWRPRALQAWQRARFGRGQSLIDFGAGPGFAAFDLADIVGPEGQIIALERSGLFVSALREQAAHRYPGRILAHEIDLSISGPPVAGVDGAWCRWIFAFLPDPQAALRRLVAALKPGAAIVVHEYLDYRTWRLVPRDPVFERFVGQVMQSWRNAGGEPDIGLEVPRWLEEAGCAVESVEAFSDCVTPADFVWQWPAAFAQINALRLADLGYLTTEEAAEVQSHIAQASGDASRRMITPMLGSIVARKR